VTPRSDGFDAVLIDFYGTISAGDREAVERACAGIVRRLGLVVSVHDFAVQWGERFFATIDRSNHEAFQTLYECETQSLRETLETYGVQADPALLVGELEAYWSNPPLYPDALDFLAGLDQPVCCVSNADTGPLLTAIGRHGLRFDGVVTSEEVRCYKPQAGIFEEAVRRLGVDPRRCLHIGDSLHSDVGGARKLGITTVWLCRESRIHDIGECQPDYTISSTPEAAAILANDRLS
jgi:2-haloacid dehalogenase/putative hydrolase of the HAD superfamily